MDRWTQRATVVIVGVFILMIGAGGLYLAARALNMPDWMQNVLVLSLGILTPSPLQAALTRRTDPQPVVVTNPESEPVPVEPTT